MTFLNRIYIFFLVTIAFVIISFPFSWQIYKELAMKRGSRRYVYVSVLCQILVVMALGKVFYFWEKFKQGGLSWELMIGIGFLIAGGIISHYFTEFVFQYAEPSDLQQEIQGLLYKPPAKSIDGFCRMLSFEKISEIYEKSGCANSTVLQVQDTLLGGI